MPLGRIPPPPHYGRNPWVAPDRRHQWRIVVADRFGPWTVEWQAGGFSARRPDQGLEGSFPYSRIILPVDLLIGDSLSHGDRVVLRLFQSPSANLLNGASRVELERFKKRVSGEVLAAVRKSP